MNLRLRAPGRMEKLTLPRIDAAQAGAARDIRVMADEGMLASWLENVMYSAWGVNGGRSGRPGKLRVNPDTPDERELKHGTAIDEETPGQMAICPQEQTTLDGGSSQERQKKLFA